MKETRADAIIVLLDRIVNATAERMSDSGVAHPPYIVKEHVYEVFQREYSLLHTGEEIPTLSYFTKIWNQHRSWVKIRKHSRFTKCTVCEQISTALRTAFRNGLPTEEVKRRKAAHIDFIALERREYKRKCELAYLYPSFYPSLVVDGANQSRYALPHFTSAMKDQR